MQILNMCDYCTHNITECGVEGIMVGGDIHEFEDVNGRVLSVEDPKQFGNVIGCDGFIKNDSNS